MVSIAAILTGVASALGLARALSPDWKSLGAECQQITYDGKTLCISNEWGGILCSTQDYNGIPIWDYRSGDVRNARVWGDKIWGLGIDGEVLYSMVNDPNKEWHKVPGNFRTLSVDGKQLCGSNFEKEILCADDELTTNPNWRKLPGNFIQLDLTDGVIYAVDDNNHINVGFSDGEAAWKTIPGTFSQVAYDGGILCGITPNLELYCATNGLPLAPQWNHYEGQFTFVEVQAGRVYAVEQSTMAYLLYLTPPAPPMYQDWKGLKTEPKLRQINFDGKTLVGTASDMGIWAARSGIDSDAPDWFKIEGLLTHVVVWGDRIYGVNVEHMVWTGRPDTDPQWRRLKGEYTQISTDGKQLCAVSLNQEIWCADTLIDSEPNWRRVDGHFQHVVVLNGVLIGSKAADDSVWVGHSEGVPMWRRLDGLNLRNFEYDGINLCGTDSDGKIICSNSGLAEGVPNLREFKGNAVYAAVNSGRIFAITADYNLYTRTD